MISSVSHRSHVWLTSRLPLYLWFQDDRDENSHVLTDFFLEELLRTNVTGSNMFHLPESFQVLSHSEAAAAAGQFHLLICPSGFLLQPSDEE